MFIGLKVFETLFLEQCETKNVGTRSKNEIQTCAFNYIPIFLIMFLKQTLVQFCRITMLNLKTNGPSFKKIFCVAFHRLTYPIPYNDTVDMVFRFMMPEGEFHILSLNFVATNSTKLLPIHVSAEKGHCCPILVFQKIDSTSMSFRIRT